MALCLEKCMCAMVLILICNFPNMKNKMISNYMRYVNFIEYGIESCGTPWSPPSQDMAHRRRRN